ncbi:hypothetical protein [Croceicoccus sp. Ery15]|uniref:hypothetical protein n=1 Tax=Croceicoccus sp. Ery15 TaxID=1703338 RepID=UPI001E54D6F5|nr:hypothetical protein [Croceicoccus sp. Ery15]
MYARTGPRAALPDAESAIWPSVAIALLLIAQAVMVHTRAINWDEFWYYSQIIGFKDGRLGLPLQTFHARAFAWLTLLDGNGVEQIVVARMVMLALELATLVAIFLLARRFADLAPSLMATLAYVSFSYVFQNGFSFRADPFATCLLMWSLVVLTRAPINPTSLLLASTLVGLAGIFTIKSILFLPAFAGMAWMRWREADQSPRMALLLVGFAIMSAVCFALLYAFHRTGMPLAPASAGHGARLSANAAQYMFFVGKPPNAGMALKGLLLSPGTTVAILAAPLLIWHSSMQSEEKLALAGMGSIILTLLFYRNTASYYFVFMLAPVSVSLAPVMTAVLKKVRPSVATAALSASTIFLFAISNHAVLARQSAVEEGVRRLFPTPVAYFDHANTLPDFDKRNLLLMPWAMQAYRDAGVPHYRQEMERRPIPLVLENWWVLSDVLRATDETQFLPADVAALQSNYIEWQWPVWVAGRQIAPGANGQQEFLVPGEYRLIGGELAVDGKSFTQGDTITLTRGYHRIVNPGRNAVKLIWADIVGRPRELPPRGPLWVPL